MRELTITDIFRILRKWLALIIIAPLVVGGAAAVYYYNYVDDTYSTSAVLYVLRELVSTSGDVTGYDWTTSSTAAQDFQLLINLSEVKTKTAEQLGVDNIDDVTVTVTTSSLSARGINVTVSGHDPQYITRVANTLTDIFVDYANEVFELVPVRKIASADLPRSPVGPQRLQSTLLAALAALAVSIGLAIAVEMLDTRIRSENDVVNDLQLPVLSNIISYKPEMEQYNREAGRISKCLYNSVSGLTRESIKTLAANVQFTAIDRPIRTITVTSTAPKEGKSSVASMLAAELSEEGKRVLIVDADFRSPTVGKLFFTRNRWDLLDYMTGRQPLESVVCKAAGANVWFIDTVHKSVLNENLLKLDAFTDFIERVKQDFDIIIFDTSPLGLYIDAAIIGARTDVTLLVVGAGVIDRQHAKESLDQLNKANANVAGVALNFISPKQHGYYGYRAYRYGSYGYTYERPEPRPRAAEPRAEGKGRAGADNR